MEMPEPFDFGFGVIAECGFSLSGIRSVSFRVPESLVRPDLPGHKEWFTLADLWMNEQPEQGETK